MNRLSHQEKMDRELLLLAHGALPLGPRLRVSAHLKRCSECRARQADLAQTSLLLASAVRGPSLPPWSQSDAVSRALPPLAQRLILPALIGLITVLVVLFCWVAWTIAPGPRPAAAVGGCRPDLPNSRCR